VVLSAVENRAISRIDDEEDDADDDDGDRSPMN
jgi:hypothetical protein